MSMLLSQSVSESENKCSDRSTKVLLSGNNDQPTDQPTDGPTDGPGMRLFVREMRMRVPIPWLKVRNKNCGLNYKSLRKLLD